MKLIKSNIKENIRENKTLVLSAIFLVLLVAFVAIPTLSTYKITSSVSEITIWDGTVASSYAGGNGTEESPYIISNGSELMFLANQLETETDYEGKYFVLNDDIILNDGIFNYTKDNGIKYLKSDIENTITPNLDNDIINIFKSLNGFKGTFNGNKHTIYGLYIDETREEQNALFTNLEGNISDLYIKNSIIYGGKFTAGIASKASNSTLTNISFDGYIISNETTTNKVINKELADVEKTVIDIANELNDYITIPKLNYIPGLITEVILSGKYETDNEEAVLKINNEVISTEDFFLNLDMQLLTEIPINYQTNIESTFKLTNLKYEIKYNYSNAAGIISIAENTTLKNIINKANVYGSVLSSGIVNTISGTINITNTYNNGIITSNEISTGIVSNIYFNYEDISIINSYNNGELNSNSSSLIGNVINNEGNITLKGIFNTKDNYGINLIENTTVYITNSYVVSDKKIKTGTSSGEFTKTTESNLKTKSFIKEKLGYQEYEENSEIGVWVWNFESDSLPIIYVDELNQPIIKVYVSNENVWNDYKTQLSTLKFADRIVLSINQVTELNPVKEIYYYISNEQKALSKEEVRNITEWQPYEGLVEINEEGFYVVYIKIIDNSNNENYVNTDLMILDLTGSDIAISATFTNDTWNIFNTELNKYYINEETIVSIQTEDLLSGVNKVYYYQSDIILTQEELEKITEWIEYTKEINVSSNKTIIYAKVVDNCNHLTYANTDLIILNGYTLNSLTPGMNGISSEELNITSKSSVSLEFTYQDYVEYQENSTHKLVSNVLLPKNTKITLIDKIKNKVYGYTTTDEDYGYTNCIDNACEATYDFKLFNEIGSTIKFQENSYTGIINENFIIIFDFKNANITNNIENIIISLKMTNNNSNENRNTLISTLKKFNIINENSSASFNLTSTFNDTINYSEDAIYSVDFVAKINYQKLKDNKIYDTTYEDKNIGLSIKMIDSTGNTVAKKHLKNILFKINEQKYSPSNDGIVRIDLEKGLSDITDNLIIQTYSDNSSLETGNYKFIITLYTAYAGGYSNENLASIEIPVYVGKNKYFNDNNFNVIMNNEDKIVTTNINEFNFEALVSEPSSNNYIKMVLYKKNSLSAYDQNYTKIELGEFLMNNSYESAGDNEYYVSRNVNKNNLFNVTLDTSLLEKKGYMFVFELYEDNKLVNKISKKFIVK